MPRSDALLTVDCPPVVVEGEHPGERAVRVLWRHGLGAGLLHVFLHLEHGAEEESVRRAAPRSAPPDAVVATTAPPPRAGPAAGTPPPPPPRSPTSTPTPTTISHPPPPPSSPSITLPCLSASRNREIAGKHGACFAVRVSVTNYVLSEQQQQRNLCLSGSDPGSQGPLYSRACRRR
jgi:hypothetical protein